MSAETYNYKGISAGKYVEGTVEALSQEEASFKLKEQKIIITNLVKTKKKAAEKKKSSGGGISLFKKKIKPEDVVIFSKQFATMVKAGLPILNVLTMLRDQLELPELKIIIEARTPQISLCNFTNHSYFNLDYSDNLKNHYLLVKSD